MDDEKIIMDYCLKCNLLFNITDLVRDKRLKRGYKKLCKNCQSIAYKIYKSNNNFKIKKQRKASYDKNIKPILNEHLSKIISKNPIRYKARSLKNSMVQSSKKRNMDYDKNIVNINYIYEYLIINNNCECCNKEYCYEHKFDGIKNIDGPSVDRINSDIGYVNGNIAFICWECNNVKNNSSIEELQCVINWIKLIKERGKRVDYAKQENTSSQCKL